MSTPLSQGLRVESAIDPVDINGAGANGAVISMKGYGHCSVIIKTGVLHNSGSSAVTMEQGTAIAFGTSKALGFNDYWKEGTQTTATSNTFTIAGTDDSSVFVIEVDASTMDVANGYDCLRVVLATPGAYSFIVDATYVLSQPRYAGEAGFVTPTSD
jgi:hypothetical protein